MENVAEEKVRKEVQMARITMRAARVNSKRTQEQMAAEMGISRSYYNDIETGKVTDVKPVYIYAFCQITGFTEDDLILPTQSTKRS